MVACQITLEVRASKEREIKQNEKKLGISRLQMTQSVEGHNHFQIERKYSSYIVIELVLSK